MFEQQYLEEMRTILAKPDRKTRNSVTKSKFGCTIHAENIGTAFPLLNTKRIYWKGVVEELLWFLKGQTDNRLLQEKDVHIWDGNSTREFLDSRGLTSRAAGDCGPIYGFQWRHFGATYVDCGTDYSGQGIDQLRICVDQLINDPYSRRILFSGWNPLQIDEMALPPCHVSYQFYVEGEKLNCYMYQRSGDMFLGVPFNIASTSLLVCILAHYCGYIPGDVKINICDAHIYSEHFEAVETQLCRIRSDDYPTVAILDPFEGVLAVSEIIERIEKLTADKIVLTGYKPQTTIKAPMIA